MVSLRWTPGATGVHLRPASSVAEHLLGKKEAVGSIPTLGSVVRAPSKDVRTVLTPLCLSSSVVEHLPRKKGVVGSIPT